MNYIKRVIHERSDGLTIDASLVTEERLVCITPQGIAGVVSKDNGRYRVVFSNGGATFFHDSVKELFEKYPYITFYQL